LKRGEEKREKNVNLHWEVLQGYNRGTEEINPKILGSFTHWMGKNLERHFPFSTRVPPLRTLTPQNTTLLTRRLYPKGLRYPKIWLDALKNILNGRHLSIHILAKFLTIPLHSGAAHTC